MAVLKVGTLLAIILACTMSAGYEQVFRRIRDARLCNNVKEEEEEDRRNATSIHTTSPLKLCASEGYAHDIECDDRRILDDDCVESILSITSFSSEHFDVAAALDLLDLNISIRRISIYVSSASTMNNSQLGAEIDLFLTPRLWWYVVDEPSSLVTDPPTGGTNTTLIRFDRLQHQLEVPLRYLANKQYPSSESTCAASVLLLGRHDMGHPGWWSIMTSYMFIGGHFRNAILSSYVSLGNDPADNVSFMTGSDCPHAVNKWTCAFLSPTNCSVPTSIITTCHTFKCVLNCLPDTELASAVFTSASTDGVYVSKDNQTMFHHALERSQVVHPLQAPHEEVLRQQQQRQQALSSPLRHEVLYLKPRGQYLPSVPAAAAVWSGPFKVNFDLFPLFFLRFSHLYRSIIRQKIHAARDQFGFLPTDRCLATHVRRGDRANELSTVSNITHYCLTNHRSVGHKQDLGCYSVPFVSVELSHIIDGGSVILEPGVTFLVVSTDDEQWLDQQKEKLAITHPAWTVVHLRAPTFSGPTGRASKEYLRFLRHQSGTDGGTFLFGSIELSRQCEGFVGHFGSGFTEFIYHQLCMQHRSHEYICPPAYDLRHNKALQTNISHP